MKTSVVIATRNSIDTIGECLSSLMPYYETGYIGEIIVVDGNSSDGTLEIIKKFPVKLLTDAGKGVYAGLDIAWRNTSHELVMFIDSDAYLDAAFFPAILDYFKDEKVGIVGCIAQAAAGGRMAKSIGQWWGYNANVLAAGKKPKGFLNKLYYHAIGYSDARRGYTSGPLYIARRSCLEKVHGFSEWLYLYDISPRLQYPGDVYLSRSIVASGWISRWWLHAPAFHHTPSHLKKLVKQRYEWGKGDGVLLRLSHKGWTGIILPPLLRLGAPALGLVLAVRYRNTLQMVLFPLAHFVWVVGYLMSPYGIARPRIE